MTLDFNCVFCGKQCHADSENGSLLHVMPMCKTFEELDPIEFMKRTNLKVAERRGVGLG